MDAGRCCIIGLKSVLQYLFDTEGMEEFPDHQESSIRGKFTSIEIYDKLLIAFELDFL